MTQYLLRLSVFFHFSIFQNQHGVRHRTDHSDVVRNDKDRCPILFSDHFHLLYDLFLNRNIQCRSRLIRKQNLRF